MPKWVERKLARIKGLIGRMRRTGTTAGQIAILALLLGAMGGGMVGRVLCLGEDGHVSVEAAAGRLCADFLGVLSRVDCRFSPGKVLAATRYSCGACIDFSISVATPARRFVPAQNLQERIPGSAGFACVPVRRGELSLAGQHPALFPPVNTTLLSLRAVVLLI